MARRAKMDSVSDEDFQKLLDTSNSYREILAKLGYGITGGSYLTLKDRIKTRTLDTKQLEKNRRAYRKQFFKRMNTKYSLKELLVENSSAVASAYFRKRLISEKILDYSCKICKISEWRTKSISFQLDHINGNKSDNRIENLRFLCPNCHSQTPTWGNKSEKKKLMCPMCKRNEWKGHGLSCLPCAHRALRRTNRPSISKLKNEVKTLGYCATGRKYGVSDNAIRKWLKPR